MLLTLVKIGEPISFEGDLLIFLLGEVGEGVSMLATKGRKNDFYRTSDFLKANLWSGDIEPFGVFGSGDDEAP